MPKVGNELKKAITEEKPKPSGAGAAAIGQIMEQLLQERRYAMMIGSQARMQTQPQKERPSARPGEVPT
jgi:hypothetical protein